MRSARRCRDAELGRDRLSRPSDASCSVQSEPGDVSGVSRSHLAGEARGPRDRDRARRGGWPLRIAAKVDPADAGYFESEIEPLLDDPLVEFIGEIGEAQKNEFLGGARALLFPIDWPEPFGLVMIEALACGTPVVAFRGGSVPEVIDDGVDRIRRRRSRTGDRRRPSASTCSTGAPAGERSSGASPRAHGGATTCSSIRRLGGTRRISRTDPRRR